MKILSVQTTADCLGVAVTSLLTTAYRRRLGLPVCRIGRKIGFLEEDVDALIARGREVVSPDTEEVRYALRS